MRRISARPPPVRRRVADSAEHRRIGRSVKWTGTKDTEEDLGLLFAPGSSLGGARPKASVIEKDGHLAIAKFPRKDDEINTVVWESVALILAQKSGIAVPEGCVEIVARKPVLLRRFDREGKRRIPFLRHEHAGIERQ